MFRRSPLFLLGLIVLVAAWLRLWRLDVLPPGLHFDEAVYGLMAQEISAGARPVFFPSFVGREPLYMYLIALVYPFTGVNILALRLTSALVGLATIPVLYLLGSVLFSRRVGLLTAALAAVGFWPLFISRIAYPVGLIPLLTAGSVALLWHGHIKKRLWAFAAGGALAGLSLYTYPAARLFPVALILMAVALAVEECHNWRRWLTGWLIAALTTLLVFAPLGAYFLAHPEQLWERANQVLVTQDQPIAALPGIFWRQVIAVAGAFIWRGDPIPLYNDPEQATVDWLVRPFFLLGLILAIRSRRQSPLNLLPLWLIGSSLPAVLTSDPVPSFLRLTGAIPPMLLLTAIGLERTVQWLVARPALQGGEWKDPLKQSYRWLAPSLLVLLLVLAGVSTAWRYFADWGRRDDIGYWFEADHVRLAEAARDELAASRTLVIAAEHFRHPTVMFLTPEAGEARWVSGYQSVVFPVEGSAVYLWPATYFPLESRFGRAIASQGQVSLLGDALGRPTVARATINGVGLSTNQPPLVRWEDILLFSANPETRETARGDLLTVELYWSALKKPTGERRFALFLEDDQSVRWAQTDSLGYEAEQWRAGDQALQWLDLRLDATMPPGEYEVRLGLANEKAEPLSLSQEGLADRFFAHLGLLTVLSDGGYVAPITNGKPLGDFRVLEHGQVAGTIQPGQKLTLTALWQATSALANGGNVVIEAVDESGNAHLLLERQVAGETPWLAGEVREGRYVVTIPNDLSSGDYGLRLRTRDAIPTASLGRLRVEAVNSLHALPANAVPTDVLFDGRIRLVGHSPLPVAIRPGETTTVTLYWQTAREGSDEVSTFVHLLGRDGRLHGQHDSPPAEGKRPYAGWRPDEIIEDVHHFMVPSGTLPGQYHFEVGLYDSDSLKRWSGNIEGSKLVDDRLLLGPISVVR